jgi:hypothetical protein
MGNMAGVLQEAETAYSSGAPESTPGFFGGVHAAHVFSFKCCLYCFGLVFVVLRSSSVVFDNNRKIIELRFFFREFDFFLSFLDIFYQRLASYSIIQKYFSNKCVGIFATTFYVNSRNTKWIFEKYF